MKNIKIKKIDYKEAPLNLLLLADPSEEAIKKYIKRGICSIAIENNKTVGCYILVKINKNTAEIMNIAVIEKKRNEGVGRELINDAIKWSKKEKLKKIVTGTGNSSISQLAFYQRCGFRIVGIKKDFFVKRYKNPVFENGIRCKDMIRLELILNY